MNEKLYIPLAIVLSGIIIGGFLYFAKYSANQNQKIPEKLNNDVLQATSIRPIDNTDHILGSPKADVIIVEYSDTECPYCKTFYKTLQRIMKEYGANGSVAWVYRHFPLHTKALKQSEATECAGELGGNNLFWAYLTELYTQTNSNNTLDENQLPIIAKKVGLDVSKFNTCLDSGKHKEKVENDNTDAIKAGGQGTPFTVLITKDGGTLPIHGEQEYSSIKSSIDILLQK